jgi:hypothetical protein
MISLSEVFLIAPDPVPSILPRSLVMSGLNSEDYYVVLETNHSEIILETAELQLKLHQILQDNPDLIPLDLRSLTLDQQVRSLLDTVCELDMDAGQYLQWYAVRLEK